MDLEITSSLRPNQELARDWAFDRILEGKSGIILAPTGFGKTIFSILIHTLTYEHDSHQTLILVPSVSLIRQFQKQLLSHTNATNPDDHILVFHGPKRHTHPRLHDTPIIITTYATMRQEFKDHKETSYLFNTHFQHLILDEAHRGLTSLRNITWIATHTIDAQFVWPFTATGIVNSASDIQVIAKLADINESPSTIVQHHSFSCKKDTSSIPEMHTFYHKVHASGNQLYYYRCILEDAIQAYNDLRLRRHGVTNGNVLAKITKLRIAAIHHQAYSHTDKLSLKQLAYPKFNKAIDIIKHVPAGDNVIVFSSFTKVLKVFSQFLDHHNIHNIPLNGSLTNKQSAANIEEFQNTPLDKTSVLVANIKKAGVGLNLQRANHVIFLEPSWNPAEPAQARDRVFRHGQTKQTYIHNIYDHKSIELWIHQLSLNKAGIYNQHMIHNHYSSDYVPEKFNLNLLFRFLMYGDQYAPPPTPTHRYNNAIRTLIKYQRRIHKHQLNSIRWKSLATLVKAHVECAPGGSHFHRAMTRFNARTKPSSPTKKVVLKQRRRQRRRVRINRVPMTTV